MDWGYFNSLSLLLRSIVWNYGEIPVQNPWMCGGLELMSNPQTRIFSPFFILDILFHPHKANLFSLMIYAFFGLWGGYVLFRDLKVSKLLSTLGAVLFINGSFFGLHYAEGHIPFGCMQLFPWILYCYRNLDRKEIQFLLVSLFSLFILDGGIYAAILSALIALLYFPFFPNDFKKLLISMNENRVYSSLIVLSFVLISSAKIGPVVMYLSSRTPLVESFSVPLELLHDIFLYPVQDLRTKIGHGSYLRFHEFGCYLGYVSLFLIIVTHFKKELIQKNWRYLTIGLLFFWAAMGWGTPFNPWVLFQKIPLINNAHVQSRLLILFFLFYVILWVHSLQSLEKYRRIFYLLVFVFLLESFWVRNVPPQLMYQSFPGKLLGGELIRSTNLNRTLRHADVYSHYRKKNAGSRFCYEPANLGTRVNDVNQNEYKGEIYTHIGDGEAELLEYRPGKIRIAYSGQTPLTIKVNTNQLDGWKVNSGDGTVEHDSSTLLQIRTHSREGELTLIYRPPYFWPVLIMYFLGVLLWAGLLRFLVKTQRNQS